MRKIFCFIIFIFIISSALAQTKNYSKPEGYDYYLKLLKNSKDSLYNSIIETFDNYIEEHPNEYLVHIERCKLIENAYYDSEEDYNPNSEEAESCKQELKASFPNVPEVMIYEAEYLYEDTGLDYLKLILKDIQTNSGKWANKETWKIYKQLGEIYSDKKLYDNAIKYGELAVANNDTLDLSLFLAKQYNAKSNTKKAIELLESNIDSTDEAWELNQKGKMLLELGSPGKAITAFRLASKDTIEWVDNGDFADALIENGFYAEARIYLIKNLENNWSKSEAHQKLFIYDLSYSSIDSAKASYKELVKDDFWVDPVGIYRLRLFLHAPFLSWSFLDVLRIFLLFGIVLLAFLIPYALVLPIHYAGMHFKNRGMILQPSRFRWGMRHFWFICSFLLLTDLIATLIFQYEVFFSRISENDNVLISRSVANYTIFVLTGYMISTIALIRKSDLVNFWGRVWSKKNSILKGIGMALILRFGLGIYLRIVKELGVNTSQLLCFTSINDNILSINQFYHPAIGFLFVVVLVPIYEEFIFRGILLSATEKYMKFILANILQATGFALLHMEWILFPFFLAFGLVAGHLRRKSQSLAPGISMHMTNNMLSFFAITMAR